MLLPAIYRAAYLGFMFGANLLLANLLEPAGLGQLSLLVLNASLVSLISGFGSEAMAMHAMAQQKWDHSYGFSFLAKITAVQLVLFVVLQALNWNLFGNTLLARGGKGLVWLEMAYFAGLVVTEKALVAFYAIHRAKRYNFLLLLGGALYLLLLAACWFWQVPVSSLTLLWLVAIQAFLQALVLVVFLFFTQRHLQLKKIHWGATVLILRSSVVVMITNVVQLMAYRVDYWLLRHFYSNFEVGIYAQANKFASLLWLLPNIFASLLIPRFGSMQAAQIPPVFRLGNVLNLVMLLITTTATWIIYFYFLLPQYRNGWHAFLLMLPGYFCWALVILLAAYFSWKGAFTVNLLASSFCLLLIGAADLLLIPRFAVNGAALANTIAYSMVLVFYCIWFVRSRKGSYWDLIYLRRSDFKMLEKMKA